MMLKKYFLNSSERIIKNYYPNYNDIKMKEIMYGVEGIYLTISKLIIIFFASYFLDLLKETSLLILFFFLIRSAAFGMHASRSIDCLLSSLIIFIGAPYLATVLVIPFHGKILLGLICLIGFLIYAPADTKKKPLLRRVNRIRLKVLSLFVCVSYIVILILVNNNTISNLILFSLMIEVALILPITYKIFNQSYRNYKNYKKTVILDK